MSTNRGRVSTRTTILEAVLFLVSASLFEVENSTSVEVEKRPKLIAVALGPTVPLYADGCEKGPSNLGDDDRFVFVYVPSSTIYVGVTFDFSGGGGCTYGHLSTEQWSAKIIMMPIKCLEVLTCCLQ